MAALPTGTVTFLFTDIEGSTRLIQQLSDVYANVLLDCRRLVRTAVQERGGQEVDTEGDAVFAAFPSGREALMAAVTAQQRILRQPWPDGAAVRVRIGLHTGEARVAEGGYIGMDVHRAARICAAAHGGQILLLDTISALVTKDLPGGVSLRDLGEHRLKDLAHPHRLFQVLAPDLPTHFPPLRSLDARPHNLPIQLTSFIGRAREIAEVKGLLAAARLVTLTGSGGAGKTRLALQVAAEVVEGYPDGVWLAELASIADSALIPKTVASALGVPEQPGRDMTETLVVALRRKDLLLVLDNCEHLLAGCADLAAALLRACPKVRVLATSQEGLDVPGETLWRVPSLSLPDIRHLPPSEGLVLYEAVRLFVDRAMAIAPEFTVTIENAAAVAQVCHRLDGIPLAIELAAARVKVLAVEQIATRLDDRFRLLTGGSRMVLPRHQTLRAAIDWSYHLLSETERVLLPRVSVFAGGWTLEAAESVCADESLKATAILDLLASLVAKSLVLAEMQRGEARYRLLETVRQYARDRLLEAAEEAEVRTRHRDWYLRLAERADPELRGPGQGIWLERLDAEVDNLRAALELSRTEPDGAEAELRLAGALYWFWFIRGQWSEGRGWLEGALGRGSDAPPAVLTKVLQGATYLAWGQGDYAQAVALSAKGLALSRELGDKKGVACFFIHLGMAAGYQGDYGQAAALCEDGLALCRERGDKWLISWALVNAGWAAGLHRDHIRATALYAESLALARETGDKYRIAFVLRSLGFEALDQGEYSQAAERFRESLILCREVGDRRVTEQSFRGLASVACARRHYDRTARLFAAAEAIREVTGYREAPAGEGKTEQRVSSTRAALGESGFAAAWAEGRAMTLEQAIEYALAGEDQPA